MPVGPGGARRKPTLLADMSQEAAGIPPSIPNREGLHSREIATGALTHLGSYRLHRVTADDYRDGAAPRLIACRRREVAATPPFSPCGYVPRACIASAYTAGHALPCTARRLRSSRSLRRSRRLNDTERHAELDGNAQRGAMSRIASVPCGWRHVSCRFCRSYAKQPIVPLTDSGASSKSEYRARHDKRRRRRSRPKCHPSPRTPVVYLPSLYMAGGVRERSDG